MTEATIITYISSKKENIIVPTLINDNKYSFNVLPFYMEWKGQKAEINRIEIRNEEYRYDNNYSGVVKDKKNVEKYREYAPNTTQNDTYSSGQVSIFFCEGVAKGEINGSTLIIEGSHYASMWRGFAFEPFELVGINESWNKEGGDNKLILEIKERGITNNNSNCFSPTITRFLINFGPTGAGMHDYAEKLQVGKKYHFNGDRLENAKILVGSSLGTQLDLNNSADKVPEIRVFNEEGEIITHNPHKDNSSPEKKSNQLSLMGKKLLLNLDKIGLDPVGALADAELIKGSEVEEKYRGGINNAIWNAWNDKVHQIEIQGEKINLIKLSRADKLAVRKSIIAGIKSNPQDWKIENSNIFDIPSQGTPDSFKVLRHKSDRRHWNVGIIYLNESLEKGKQDWAEIESLLGGKSLSTNNQADNDWIKKYFQENDIHTITLEGDKLLIKYNNKKEKREEANNFQRQLIKQILEQQKNHSLSFPPSPSVNNSQSNQNKNNYRLAIGLTLGAGVVSLIGIVIYFWNRKKKQV